MKGIFAAVLFLGHWLATEALPVVVAFILIGAGAAAWFIKATDPTPVTVEQKLYQAGEEERALNRSLGRPEGAVIPELRDIQLRELGTPH